MKARGIFIAGTGTGVGKTLVAALCVRALKSRGLDAGVMKPVATGCKGRAGEMESEDARYLVRASGVADPMRWITPAAYRPPLAPLEAARLARRPVPVPRILQAARVLAERHDFLVVEGVGGVRVPLAHGYETGNLIRDLGFDCLLVAPDALGTVNHTLLTVAWLAGLRVRVRAIVLSGLTPNPDPSARSNARLIRASTKLPVLRIPCIPARLCANPARLPVLPSLFRTLVPAR